jgi:hypothetical protein
MDKKKRVDVSQLFIVYASANSLIRSLILTSSSSANSGLSLINVLLRHVLVLIGFAITKPSLIF